MWEKTVNFLFWEITIKPRTFAKSAFELTPYDSRYWSMEATMARLQRTLNEMGMPTLTATPSATLVDGYSASPSSHAGKRQSVANKRLAPQPVELPVCQWCNKSFRGRKGAKYCSPAHRNRSWKETKKAAQLAAA